MIRCRFVTDTYTPIGYAVLGNTVKGAVFFF